MSKAKKSSRRRPRKRICPPPPVTSERIYIQINPSKIALFRFLLEGYDNIGIFTVTNKFTGLLQLRYSPHQRREIKQFLDAVRTEIDVKDVTPN
ncbi:DUF4911 domain-containing protein [Pseudodesulfovibrio sp. zrk46]|uniref:DUF4911 domain-containing protein n=1 Tax=Pseudodesulfovibrio sp. zrk46 TaxID=2725288 RepID=UPI001449AA0A|nr:DUF4911 domain-containing protein [Pseudodesulfovibrio sp. zrk46]QJB56417.1 DUF4911 domain-containing protein [Pseudodesulfovibrio sp. zrk46]